MIAVIDSRTLIEILKQVKVPPRWFVRLRKNVELKSEADQVEPDALSRPASYIRGIRCLPESFDANSSTLADQRRRTKICEDET